MKDGFAIAWDVLRLYTGNPPKPIYLSVTHPLLDRRCAVTGTGELRCLPLVHAARPAATVSGENSWCWRWLPALILDVALPAFVLLIWPVLQLASPGNINYNPFCGLEPLWCSRCLISPSRFLSDTSALMLVGIAKAFMGWYFALHEAYPIGGLRLQDHRS